ncbi:tyrosine-protein kinase JAK2-like [Clavelina lepadiformis]|uniref:tyrosine-protein kinase JAK2-like n=1 Tax=Clavelina lepadiformis TaxID=159417 RepID=UPI0040423D95
MDFKVSVKVYQCNVSNDQVNDQKYFKDYTFQELNEPGTTTCDNILQKCADKCKISPLYLLHFALRDVVSDCWVNPRMQLQALRQTSNGTSSHESTSLLSEHNQIQLELRIRFIINSTKNVQPHRHCCVDGSSKSVFNEIGIKYLFHQLRSDFLEERIKLEGTVMETFSIALGAAVLDVLRLACEMNTDLTRALHYFKKVYKLIPKSYSVYMKSLNVINQWQMIRKFKCHVKRFSPSYSRWCLDDQGLAFFCDKYIQNLQMFVETDHCETYTIESGESPDQDFNKVTIGAECGIAKGDKDRARWCNFDQIADLTLQAGRRSHPGDDNSKQTWVVTVSQLDGSTLHLHLPSLTKAENLASCIDGYYQLFVDPHHSLCKEVCPPSLVERLACRCHGSVTAQLAEDIIKKQPGCQPGTCILRQSRESCFEYFINTVIQVNPELSIKNYKLAWRDGKLGIFGLEDSYTCRNLTAFIDTYKDEDPDNLVPFKLNQLIPPYGKENADLVVCLCDGTPAEIENGSKLKTSIGIIQLKDYLYSTQLGEGKFTKVLLYEHKEQKSKVAVKKLKLVKEYGQKQHVEDSFQTTISMSIFCENAHIVQAIGIMSSMLVLEYVPFGSITTYLKQLVSSRRSREWNSWFLSALWQLTHACNYLEWKGIPHGNIQGKNVLLQRDSPDPHIKLSDAGVSTYNKTSEERHIVYTVPMLQAPWLAWEFCHMNNRAPLNNKPTVAGDKWSYATTVCEICEWGDLGIQRADAWNLSADLKQRYNGFDSGIARVVKIPEILTSTSSSIDGLIQECWRIDPGKRPPFKKLLRELGGVLTSDYVLPFPASESFTPGASISSGANEAVVNTANLTKYNDCNLKILHCLGQGNFGTVHLCLYEQVINGRCYSEKVAVKTPHDPHTSQSMYVLSQEVKTMLKINHRHVVRIKGITVSPQKIVMEYLTGGSLCDHLHRKADEGIPITSLHPQLLDFAMQISQGMTALQEKRVIHRDLALRNILLAQDSPDSPCYAKISDFGLSRILNENSTYYSGNPVQSPILWYAPECLQKNGPRAFHLQSDIWSFGVTVWEMYSYGKIPEYSVKVIDAEQLPQLQERLKVGERLPKPEHCPSIMYHLMNECWKNKPTDRMSFEALCNELEKMK